MARYACLFVLALPQFVSAGDDMPIVLKHDGWVAAVAFSPDGKTLASAGSDKIVRLWTVGTWRNEIFAKGNDTFSSLAFSLDGNSLLIGSWDGVSTRRPIGKTKAGGEGRSPRAVLAVAANPTKDETAVADIGGNIYVDSRTQDKIAQYLLSSHKSWVNSLAFNRAGTLLASGSSDGTVRIWTQADQYQTSTELQGGSGEVRAIAFSPDGKLLAAGNRYHTVRVWDVASKKEVTTLTGHASDVWSIAFSPDGKTLAAADTDWKKPSRVKLWDTATWKKRGSLNTPGEILSIAYSPNGEWLAAGCWDKTVRVFAIKK